MAGTEKSSSPEEKIATDVCTLVQLFAGEEPCYEADPLPLEPGPNIIGRSVIEGLTPRVSERHAEILVLPSNTLRLRDLGSTNGTFVDGVETRLGPVKHQSVIMMADVIFGASIFAVIGYPEIPGDAILGSPATRKTYIEALRAAPHDATVMVTGESGSGKELIARATHDASPRKERPFVEVNCALLRDDTLLESKLFGHVKGAFTGATADRRGILEEADGGTLFLDEVGELPRSTQAALLRFLQERKFSRVGEVRERTTDVRIIAATHRDIENADVIRLDLVQRLSGIVIRTAPLRERREEILPLIRYRWFKKFNHSRSPRFTPAAAQAALLHPWLGNVRELFNVADRLFVMGNPDETISLHRMRECLDALVSKTPSKDESSQVEDESPHGEDAPSGDPKRLDRTDWELLLHKHEGVVAQVAKEVGKSDRQVRRYLSDQVIDPNDFRRPK